VSVVYGTTANVAGAAIRNFRIDTSITFESNRIGTSDSNSNRISKLRRSLFTRYAYYADEVADNNRQTRLCLLNRCAKNWSVYLRFDDVILTRSPASAGIANRPLVFLGIFLIFGLG